MVQIEIAKHAGFCHGVKRAIDIARANKNSFTLGPLIHNSQVISDLEKISVFAKTFDELKKEKPFKVIIRAHGGIKNEIKYLDNLGFEIIDATCPNVERVRKNAIELVKGGYSVFVFGDRDHAEVQGLLSYVPSAQVISSPSEINGFEGKQVGLIAQTTQDVVVFDEIVDILKVRCSEFKYHKTICLATSQRQECAKNLAEKVNTMFIIGGKNSANTKRLYDICFEKNKDSHWIESSGDIYKHLLDNITTVGITAGASTPDYVVEDVKDKIISYV